MCSIIGTWVERFLVIKGECRKERHRVAMAHIMRAIHRGCFSFEREFALASSRCLAHSLAEAHDSPDPDGFGDYEAASTTAHDFLDLELEFNLQDRSNSKANDWARDRGLDKITSRHPDGSRFLSVRRLFNLIKQKKFDEMLMVHDELAEKKKGIMNETMDIIMYSRLMTHCVRELGPQYVLPVFQRMILAGIVPNVIPYTILVRAFMEIAVKEAERGNNDAPAVEELYTSRSISLLKEMREKGIMPNMLTYKPVMSWLSGKGKAGDFQKLALWMKEDKVPFNGIFQYYEIQLALRLCDFKRAKDLYLACKEKNAKMPASLDAWFLTSFSKDNEVSVLLELLPKLLPTIKSSASVVSALQCLGKNGRREAALQCFSLLKKKGLDNLLVVGTSESQMGFYLNSYVLGYAQFHKLADAISAFREVEAAYDVKGGAPAFNILIDYCCREGEITQGLDLLDEMQARGLKMSCYSYNPFIREFARWTMIDEAFEMKAAMIRLGVRPTVVTYNSLVCVCVRLGDMERAYSLFAEMRALGVEPNTHCYNPLIMGFATQGSFDRALALVEEMDKAGVKPDINTYRHLIFACSLNRDEAKADQLFAEMQLRGIKPNQSIYSVMTAVYSKCGNIDRGIEMIRKLEKEGEIVDIGAKSAILSGLALAGRIDEALSLFDEIEKEDGLPHSYAVGALVSALGKAGNLDAMFELFEKSRGDDKWPYMNQRQRVEHLNIRCINVVLGCIRHNQLGQAITFLQKVKQEGIADEGVLFDKMFLHISNGGRDENEMCWLDVDDGFAVVYAMRELGLRPSRMALEALLDGCAAMNDSEQAQRVLQEMDHEGLHLNIFSMIRLFRAYVAGEDEERALSLLDQMATLDLKDPDVRLLLLQTLQPHYVAAADSPEAAEALETLPQVRRKVDELLGGDIIPDTDLIM